VVDDEHVECDIVLTQTSQVTQDDTDADEPPFAASNETLLNVEPVSGSVGVGDAIANAGFISGVDPQPTTIGLTQDVDPSSIESEFMPKYEAAFEDECSKDSADDRPVPELSKRDKVLLQRALVEHAPEMLDCPETLSSKSRIHVDSCSRLMISRRSIQKSFFSHMIEMSLLHCALSSIWFPHHQIHHNDI
jgi:hypothetical protein